MIARLLLLATLVGCSTVAETPDVIYDDVDEDALPSAEESAVTFHGRVLDRETLQPVANVTVTRFDGNVTVRGDERGEFAFPMDLREFGACFPTKDGGVACSGDNPATTRFFVLGADICPVLVSPRKYREWTSTLSLLAWRKASLHGTWLDAVGKPVGGRELKLESDAMPRSDIEEELAEPRAITGEQGEFQFDVVPASVSWTIGPANKEDGLVDLDASTILLAPGESRELQLHSLPTLRIHGIVRGAEGEVFPGAEVRLDRGDRRVKTETDADGSFTFDRVGTGPIDLVAIHPVGYLDTEQGTALAFDAQSATVASDLDVRLKPVREITGHVLDAQHQPIDRAEVCFEPVATPFGGRDGWQDCATDGSFRLHHLISDRVRLMAPGNDRGPQSEIRTVESGATGIEILLEPTGRITGRVSGAVLTGYEHALVGAERETEGPVDLILHAGGYPQVAELEPGQETFELERVPAGRWKVGATVGQEQMCVERDVDVQVGQTVVCPDLVLEPTAHIELVSAPTRGDLTVDIRSEADAIVHMVLPRGAIRTVDVPAGRMTIVAKDALRTVCERSVDLAPGSLQLVGLGFER